MAQVSSTPPQQRQRPQLMRQKLLLSPEQHSVEKKMTDAPVSPADTLPSLTDTTRSSSCGGGSPTNLSPPTTPIKDTINNTKTNNEAHVTFSLRSEATIGSLRSGGSGSTATTATAVRAARLSGNLMRSQHRDPFEIYKTVSVLGEGSMGSVCKVKKRSSAVGGSARPEFVKANSEPGSRKAIPCCLPILDFFHSFLPKRDCGLIVDDPTASYTFADSARSELTTSSGESSPGGALGQHKHSSSMISYNSNGSGRRREHIYALKSILLDKCANTQLQKELLHEVAILRETDHAHIARAIETFDYQNRLFICLELCSGGDLYARDPYTERQAAGIVADVLSAVAYLHSKGIIHRDLKFENIMFVDKRPDAEVKLIDFGLSQKFANQDEHMSDAVGTVYTMAPELLAGQYNAKADVWSIGVIAYMLLSSSMPFFGKTRYAVMKQICKGKVKFSSKRWKKISKYGKGFVLHLLESDPHERPSADRALRYAKRWIEQLDAQIDEANLLQQSTDSNTSVPTSTSLRRQVHWSPSRSFNSSDEMEMMDRIQASIHAFSQYNTLKKLALMVIAYKSTASEIGWIRSTFNQFDLLQNGEISLEEFTQALSDVYDYSEEELESLFVGMDVDGTGVVHYTEFLAATIEAHGAIDEDRIADAFDRIDCDDSGYITIQNLRDFLGEDVPESYLEAIIDDADKLRDKRISYDEFLQLWDPTCDATLRHAKAEVADRRARRSESLISLSGNGTESDDDYFDDYDYPTTKDQEPIWTPVPDRESNVEDQSTPLSFDKTPVMSNMGAHEYGAVEFFSQRKAMSVRAWA